MWQENGYSVKRLIQNLRETAKGRSILFSPLSLFKWIVFALYLYTVFNESYTTSFHASVILIYFFQSFIVVKDLLSSQIRKPILNKETIIVIIFSLTSVFIIFNIPLLDRFFWILFIDRITILIVSFFVFIVSFPVELLEDAAITKARNKIRQHKKLLTVGIVGSYGKSSTKEFLYQILSKKYNVIRTEGHQNKIAEVAGTINRSLSSRSQILIVEMNDFTRGDISKITEIVRPDIGIITGVNSQNLSSFKTLNDSMLSKNQLFQNLSKKGFSLFNGRDNDVLKMFNKAKKPKKVYLTNDTPPTEIDVANIAITVTNKRVKKESISFDALIGKNKIHIESLLVGEHNIENILPAIYIADFLGMAPFEIKKSALGLTPPENTMVISVNADGVTLIDDTTNTNPESLIAALEYMKLYKTKKYVVMQTMTQLGKDAIKIHEELALKISQQCDYLFITNKDYSKVMINCSNKENTKCVVKCLSRGKITDFLNSNIKSKDVVLFEGTDTRSILEKIS